MKKHLIFLLPLTAMLLSGCRGGRGGSTVNPSTSTNPTSGDSTSINPTSSTNPTSIEPPSTGPTASDNHLTGISISPSMDFVSQVGKTIKFEVKYEGSPIESEKEVKWTVSDENKAVIHEISGSHNVNVEFIADGDVTVTVTSQFNTDYVKSTKVKIYPNNEYNYVWNCGDGDKDKFTNAEGDASLNNANWHYVRHNPSSSLTGGQTIKFGKADTSTETFHEGQIDLTLANSKAIDKVIVACSSAAKGTGQINEQGYEITENHGSSKIEIKVGSETYYAADYTAKGTTPVAITGVAKSTPASGNISITFTESISYICLQYIIIIYSHQLSEIFVSPTSAHKTIFETNETFSYEGLVILAKYLNDEGEYDVSKDITVTPPDMTTVGEKTVTVKYHSLTTTYKIQVENPRSITKLEIVSAIPTGTKIYVGDKMDYSLVKLVVTWDKQDSQGKTISELAIPTANGGDFTEVNVPSVAALSMNEAFTISLKYKGVSASYTFAAGQFICQDLGTEIDFKNIGDVSSWSKYEAREIKDSNNRIKINAILKGTDVTQTDGYPVSKGSDIVTISTLSNVYSIQSVHLEFEQWITNRGEEGKEEKPAAQTIYLGSSILGTDPYKDLGVEETDFDVSYDAFEAGVNSVKISFKTAGNNIGLKKFTIKLVESTNAVIKGLSSEGSPTKTEYKEGEQFDSTGLKIYAEFDGTSFKPVEVTDYVSWTPTSLTAGTTKVTGSYQGKTIEISGIKVTGYEAKTYTKVTSISDTGTYLIVCNTKASIFNGSLTSSEYTATGSDNHIETKIDITGSSFKADYDTDQMVVTITKLTEGDQSGRYQVLTVKNNVQIGITDSGGISYSNKNLYSYAISFDENGNAILTNEGRTNVAADKVKQLGCNKTSGKFSVYASGTSTDAKIQLYKQN